MNILLLTDETKHNRIAFSYIEYLNGTRVKVDIYTAVGDAFKNDMDGWAEIERDDIVRPDFDELLNDLTKWLDGTEKE